MARVIIIKETKIYPEKEWQLCFQWCLYCYDDNTKNHGYRFIWRRKENGHLQPARGQARLPSFKQIHQLMEQANKEGWGNKNADEIDTHPYSATT